MKLWWLIIACMTATWASQNEMSEHELVMVCLEMEREGEELRGQPRGVIETFLAVMDLHLHLTAAIGWNAYRTHLLSMPSTNNVRIAQIKQMLRSMRRGAGLSEKFDPETANNVQTMGELVVQALQLGVRENFEAGKKLREKMEQQHGEYNDTALTTIIVESLSALGERAVSQMPIIHRDNIRKIFNALRRGARVPEMNEEVTFEECQDTDEPEQGHSKEYIERWVKMMTISTVPGQNDVAVDADEPETQNALANEGSYGWRGYHTEIHDDITSEITERWGVGNGTSWGDIDGTRKLNAEWGVIIALSVLCLANL